MAAVATAVTMGTSPTSAARHGPLPGCFVFLYRIAIFSRSNASDGDPNRGVGSDDGSSSSLFAER